MSDLYEFPTALLDQGDDGQATLKWAGMIVALATLGLALFNPSAISGWVGDLPPGPTNVRLAAIGEDWAETAGRIGLGAGHARLHAAWKTAERTDWKGRQPVEMAATDQPAMP
jgi:hypothetical protein